MTLAQISVVTEKQAAARHLIGAGLGAGTGALGTLVAQGKTRSHDRLLRDLGMMPDPIYREREGRRNRGVLGAALVGAGAGAGAAHVAPRAAEAIKASVLGATNRTGREFGEGATNASVETLRSYAPEFQEFATNTAETAGVRAARAASDVAEESVRGGAKSVRDSVKGLGARLRDAPVIGPLRRFITEE